MERTNKNKKRNLTDFLRYRKNEMSGEERNSFERDLQRDPFTEEASEGFSLISAEEAEKDLSAIKRKLESKKSKRTPAIYYRFAAAVAVLVTISVLFFNNRNTDMEMTLSENNTEEVKVPMTIVASEPLKEKTESPTLHLSPSPPPAAREEKENDLVAASSVAGDDAKPAEEEKKMEDAMVAGVRSKSVSAVSYPEPVTGLDSFDIWIEKNIRNPEPDNKTVEAVVLSFIVKKDSTITDLKIISSPGMAFSREAKRLITEGPMWKPAMIGGKPVDKEYRFTIRFR